MLGNLCAYAAAQMAEHPYDHVFLDRGAVQNEPDVTAVIMTYLWLKAGLKKLGEKCRRAVHSEMKQIHMKDTLIPIHRKDLTKEHRNAVLESHLLLK